MQLACSLDPNAMSALTKRERDGRNTSLRHGTRERAEDEEEEEGGMREGVCCVNGAPNEDRDRVRSGECHQCFSITQSLLVVAI